ncbi:aspartyl-phosphate phosphatase Spo0E family protein [Peribacillus saganii]|uniref:Aspartyl-phosphate phosphatase Spo0E family protein n=1 Tax=Peribacillus saganii TaxID=2303992 RepID=A0A372LSM4_9BACI|nr:aspartyl-phosphate phosphatase Spo0E family protein [Peribacillus saganii]RFU71199.1 aspartyl-phosphate phosphatase Spo0E family protein [Peribacillus saganii]
MVANLEKIGKLIQEKRNEMIKSANENGINSEHTLRFSQELDKLMNAYQKIEKQPASEVHIAFHQTVIIMQKPFSDVKVF